MKFDLVPVEDASGKILAHNLSNPNGSRGFQKGTKLTSQDVTTLQKIGYQSVYTIQAETGDLKENQAACQIAEMTSGQGLQISAAAMGRVNLTAHYEGVLQVDALRLQQINELEGVTYSTLRSLNVIQPAQAVATIKIIPYAIPFSILQQVKEIVQGTTPIIGLTPLTLKQVGLLFIGFPWSQPHLVSSFEPSIRKRVEKSGSNVKSVQFYGLVGVGDDSRIANILQQMVDSDCEMIVIAGETSTMDQHDILPTSILAAGGDIVSIGAPVDPGNLLLLAYLKTVPVLGVPGCARSLKPNVIDLVMPSLLAGIRLRRTDIARLGYGGLIEDMN